MPAQIKVYMKNEEKDPVIVGTPRVPKQFSKSFKNEKGETLYYVDKEYGIKHKLISKMDFSKLLPTNPDMCRITIKIDRI